MLLCLALLGQSCVTSVLIASAVHKSKQNKRIENEMKLAEARGPLVNGEYRITDPKEDIVWPYMEEYCKKHNYYILANENIKKRSKSDSWEVVKYVDYVSKANFLEYYYRRLSKRNDFSNLKKGKLCYVRPGKRAEYGVVMNALIPRTEECLWSGEVDNGFINGKGAGIVIDKYARLTGDKPYLKIAYVSGFFDHGIPLSDFYYTNFSEYEKFDYNPKPVNQVEPHVYIETYKDNLDPLMRESFIKSYSKRMYDQYKESIYDVEKIVSSFKGYAEHIVMNEIMPELSCDLVGHDKPVLGVAPSRMLSCNEKGMYHGSYGYPLIFTSPEAQSKRHTLMAFKNYEGINMSLIDEENKQLLEKENQALSEKIDITLMYMDLLDGLALTSSENQKLAEGYLGKSQAGVIGGGAHDVMISSNYWYTLLNAKDIAKTLQETSTGNLKNKYAVAEKKISSWFDKIYAEANTAIEQVNNYRSEAYDRFISSVLSSGGGSSSSESSAPKLTNSCRVHLYFKDGSVVSNETIRAGYTTTILANTKWSEKYETDENGYVTLRWSDEIDKLNWIVVPLNIGAHFRYQKDDLELTNGGVYEICLDCD